MGRRPDAEEGRAGGCAGVLVGVEEGRRREGKEDQKGLLMEEGERAASRLAE